MLFFKSLAVFSTLAFGALSALAAPAASAVENGLVARCDCDSIPTIFADVKADLKVHIDALGRLHILSVDIEAHNEMQSP